MKKFNVKEAISCIKEQRDKTGKKWPWDTVLAWAENLEVEYKADYRDHTFTCGTRGEVIDTITFVAKFKRPIDMQAHCDFEEELAHSLFERLVDELQGYWENCQE